MTKNNSRNHLDRAGRTKLIIWVSQNEETLKKLSDREATDKAGKELGLHGGILE